MLVAASRSSALHGLSLCNAVDRAFPLTDGITGVRCEYDCFIVAGQSVRESIQSIDWRLGMTSSWGGLFFWFLRASPSWFRDRSAFSLPPCNCDGWSIHKKRFQNSPKAAWSTRASCTGSHEYHLDDSNCLIINFQKSLILMWVEQPLLLIGNEDLELIRSINRLCSDYERAQSWNGKVNMIIMCDAFYKCE